MDSFETDPVVSRLRGIANPSVDPEVASNHLQAMASAPVAVRSHYRLRTAMAGSLLAGALVSGAGIAAASGALPGPAQAAAHRALASVGVHVPDQNESNSRGSARGSSGDHGTARFTTDCTNLDRSAFTGNHGQYVSSHPDDPATLDVNEREQAAKSDCGKPLVSVHSTTGAAEDHGQSGDTHGQSTGTHGKSTGTHGQSGDTHGQSTDTHGQSSGDQGVEHSGSGSSNSSGSDGSHGKP